MSVTSIRLNSELEQPLNELSEKLDRSKNYLINQAIKDYVEREAVKAKRWQETLEALKSVEEGRVISGEAVFKWMDTWGSDNELPPPKVGD